ncbi:MAG: alkaline phosphatase family protein, partial [Blastocatellia bacterium]
MNPNDRKLLVIGLDGASFNVLDSLIENGLLPNLAGLISRGSRADLITTFPPITAVAWSSFMTGKNPGKHGIFEFVRRDRESDRELAVNASFRRGAAIWDLLSRHGKRVIVHNFPCTYPPHPVNGLMIADFMTPKGRTDYSYPRELLGELEQKFGPYRLHLAQTYSKGNVGAVLDELFDELEYKARVTDYLMTEYEWDAFFQYFWGTDRIQHELWHIIDDSHPRYDPEEAAKYRDRVYAYFHRVDEIVGQLCKRAGDDALVWVASDHGFGPVHKYCSFNLWMMEEGFLKLRRNPISAAKLLMFKLGITPELAFKIVRMLPLGRLRPARGVSNQPGASTLLKALFLSSNDIDWDRTLAFSKGNYGQIYVNLKGREPNGSVEQSDYKKVCQHIIERLKLLKDPATGEQWVDRVFHREEIYKGAEVENAPDIAYLPRDMRYLPIGNADFTSNKFIVDAFGISGCHRMNGVMLASGG